MYISFTDYGDDGDDEGREIRIPAHNVVCSQCGGTGKSSAYLGAFTQSDMDENGPEFMEDYFRGEYDRTCETCQGNKVVLEPDDHQPNAEDWRKYNAYLEEKYADERMHRMEMEAEYGPSYRW